MGEYVVYGTQYAVKCVRPHYILHTAYCVLLCASVVKSLFSFDSLEEADDGPADIRV